jgi:CRISPR-associated endonuclease/helicase Cas3
MRWQLRLLERLRAGDAPDAVDLPTGLGKTAVMALWLIARALPSRGTILPRRLVYVVDRRAVVDQASHDATRLAAVLAPDSACVFVRQLRVGLGLAAGATLPVATLRGALADRREWLRDPAVPAIIVGTVDMIGSRLLFEGYGVSRRMRPLHAGLLGFDTLVVLDEAHLVPPFEALMRQVAVEKSLYAAVGEGPCVPWLRLMPLSATLRSDSGAFGLATEDNEDLVAQQRIGARKTLHKSSNPIARKDLAKELAERAWARATEGGEAVRIVVFCDRREDAGKVAAVLRQKPGKPACELLVGERRVRERQVVADWIARHGFQPGVATALPGPAFLVATSAGEVGIDVDAEHMVADLVEWERMVQRLGRVNRRGAGDARIDIIGVEPEKFEAPSERERRAAATASLLRRLPEKPGGGRDASPGALLAFKADAACVTLLSAATTPPPLRPALTRALVDAWSLTSLEEHTGRPEVGPWLRGWVEDDEQTTLIWRCFLPWRRGEKPKKAEVDEFFEYAPPERGEQLEAPVFRALEVLRERARARLASEPGHEGEPAFLVLSASLTLEDGITLAQLRDFNATEAIRRFADRTLVVTATLGGLSADGLLDKDASRDAATPDDRAAKDGSAAPVMLDGAGGMASDRLLILRQAPGVRPEPVPEAWTLAHTWPARLGQDGEPVEEVGIWTLEAGRADPALVRTRAQSLAEHTAVVVECAESLATRLGLDPTHRAMLVAAARLHDLGKASRVWQDAFGAPRDGRPYGKTSAKWVNQALLDGYRHEFGSLSAAAADPGLRALRPDLRDLALHLIVSHHGGGRPLIRHGGEIERAGEVALRFARLQRRWGPWGLAWWESLLRAADLEASRRHDEGAG